jgi:hypothetical protein
LTYSFSADTAGSQSLQAKYEKDGMTRATVERTIAVRDIADPLIQSPANGTSITYAQGELIALVASGEPGATFTWFLDGAQIALGNRVSFDPKGISGQKQLRLTTAAFGRTKETLVTITLAVDSPPILTLTAPAVQLTGQALAWTATAFDIEDQASPQIEIFFDGVAVAAGSPKLLASGDIGQHTIMARAKDTHGMIATRQVSIVVEPAQVPIEIQSPLGGKAYFLGYAIPLMASLGSGSEISGGPGTFAWTIQYLDDTNAQADSASGQSASFSPKAAGDATVSLRYLDSAGKERGAKSLSIRIEREPLELAIDWPHGTVVNGGITLKPRLLGLPQGASADSVAWTLNGAPVANIAAFVAPAEAGQYLLLATYSANGSSETAQVVFTVNAAPRVTIENPSAGKQFALGSPVVLAAKVEDDQAFDGTITWRAGSSVLGTGNPFVLAGAASGSYQVIAEAQDRYGASGNATVAFSLYAPVSNIVASVNGGQPVYLLSPASPPLSAKVSFAGGIAPAAAWTVRQGERSQTKIGAEVGFAYEELAQFAEGAATVTLNLSDPGLADEAAREILRKDFPFSLAKNAVATLASPVPGDLFRVGESVPLRVDTAGFNVPSFALSLNGATIGVPWTKLENGTSYYSEIPSSVLPREGVYDLVLVLTENGSTSSLAYTLNVYKPRTGIFVDDAPAQYELLSGSRLVNAVVAGLEGVTEVLWKTDLSGTPVATGRSLDLAAAGLKPGNRAITVEARSGTQSLASATFLLKVTGAMEIAILPADEPLIVQRGGALTLEARVIDKDGSALSGDAITWTSHLDGLLGKGTSLDLAPLSTLSGGDHIFTVEGTGAGGSKISALKRIQVRVALAGDPGGGGSDDDDSAGGDADEQDDLDEGEEMRGGSRRPRQLDNGTLAMAAAVRTALSETRYRREIYLQAERLFDQMSGIVNSDNGRALIAREINLQMVSHRRSLADILRKMVNYTRESQRVASRAISAEAVGNNTQAEAFRKAAEQIADEAEELLLSASELFERVVALRNRVAQVYGK